MQKYILTVVCGRDKQIYSLSVPGASALRAASQWKNYVKSGLRQIMTEVPADGDVEGMLDRELINGEYVLVAAFPFTLDYFANEGEMILGGPF